MEVPEIIKALRRNMVETGSLICFSCGHEHNCSIKGCAIMREAADALENLHRAAQKSAAEVNQLKTKDAALKAQYDEINRYNISCTKEIDRLLAEKLAAKVVAPKNRPLTLEELKQMNGEPVWIEVLDRPDLSRWHFIVRHPKIGLIAKDGLGQYECYPHNSDRMVFSGCYYDIQYGHNYGKTWIAYARKPEGSEKA